MEAPIAQNCYRGCVYPVDHMFPVMVNGTGFAIIIGPDNGMLLLLGCKCFPC